MVELAQLGAMGVIGRGNTRPPKSLKTLQTLTSHAAPRAASTTCTGIRCCTGAALHCKAHYTANQGLLQCPTTMLRRVGLAAVGACWPAGATPLCCSALSGPQGFPVGAEPVPRQRRVFTSSCTASILEQHAPLPSSPAFQANAARLAELVQELQHQLQIIRLGGGSSAVARHHARGKL